MPRKRIYTILFLAMTVGAIFAFSTYRYVLATPERGVPAKMTPVVVAASNLDLGAALRAEDLRTIDWPSERGAGGHVQQPAGAGRPRVDPAGRPERADAADASWRPTEPAPDCRR